ncbi:MAG: DUF4301 family protein [Bacteroidales bacterium]|nr:DUF4301 family protein [Candidatus Physcousia equi]
MLTAADKQQLQEKGISEEQIAKQLTSFREGFPYLKLRAAASVGNGILSLNDDEVSKYIQAWDAYKAEGHHITKFVPASGAASRMFKNMFEFLSGENDEPTTPFEKKYFDEIHNFAFYPALDDACHVNEGEGVDALMAKGNYKAVVANMLNEDGLNYGQLPKGLLQFHSYDDEARTPLEEHLVEAALYATSRGEADVHFTVSTEHRELFEELVERVLPEYEAKYGIKYHVSFSEQKPSTDTLAATMDNEPFRTDDGKLLFRPGGHGALIQNLSDLESDIVFVKNIDNVVPDRLKDDTVTWKQVIAGVLVTLQKKAFEHLALLDSGTYTRQDILDIIQFVRHDLYTDVPALKTMEDAELVSFLKSELNRPMRVCGVVKNVGEPGGGPFLAYNPDGTISAQILESSQIDNSNADYMKMFSQGTHFNPVDLVCAIRNSKGEKFDLPRYVDPATGFISYKSKNGKELKALELPGLWNGAMSNWSTVFVEVPLSTFNPVKTVNDLLREQHQ